MKTIFAVGDQQWLNGLTPQLDNAQVRCRRVRTKKELAKCLKKETPLVVLCDLKMSESSGVDVLRLIRAEHVDIPIVMVKDPATFDFDTLTDAFEINRYAPKANGREVSAAKLSLSTAPELHNPHSGRLDARRIAAFFGLAPARFAKILGRSPQAMHKTPDAESLQRPLAVFARIATSLISAFAGREQARMWLHSPNPDLDEARPIELVELQKAEVVADLLEDALLGHPG